MDAFGEADKIEGLKACHGPGSLIAVGVAGRRVGRLASGELFFDQVTIPLDTADLGSDNVISMLDARFEVEFPPKGPDALMTAAAYIAKKCLRFNHDDDVTSEPWAEVPERTELIATIVVLDPSQRIVPVDEPESEHMAPDGESLISKDEPDVYFPLAAPYDKLPVIATAQSSRGGQMARLIIALQLESTKVVHREAVPDKSLQVEE